MLDLFIFNHRVTSLRVVKVELCACCFVVGEWLWSFISYGAAVDPRRSIPIVVIFIPFICNHHDGWMRVKVGLKAFLVFMVPSSSCRVLTQRWKESLKSLKSVEIVEKCWNRWKSVEIVESWKIVEIVENRWKSWKKSQRSNGNWQSQVSAGKCHCPRANKNT